MHVQQLVLERFMSHDQTTLTFPSRGIVVVGGENGEGKSSLVEAVAMALWGKTLRGTDGFREGESGRVQLVGGDGMVVERSCTKAGAKRLRWARAGEALDEPHFDNSTKAQEALSLVVGDLDMWRRTHVFSSSDAAFFSTATDGDRKHLIERLLGLEVIDQAYGRCRVDVQAVQAKKAALDAKVGAAQAQLRQIDAMIARMDAEPLDPIPEQPPAPPDATLLERQLQDLEERYKILGAQEHTTQQQLRETQGTFLKKEAEAEAAVKAARRAHELVLAGRCSLCGQLVTDHGESNELMQAQLLLENVRQEAEQVLVGVHHAWITAKESLETAGRTRIALHQQMSQQRLLSQQYLSWADQVAQWEVRRQRRQVQWDQLAAERRQVQFAMDALARELVAVDEELLVLTRCTEILGLKGVRASLIAGALAGVEAVANSWCQRFKKKPMSISLKPYTEKKGSVSDAISLDVHGVGGGRGYRATSNGERRRIDVVLTLAQAEIASRGMGGTLFFDEVFDALDGSGVDAVCEALQELAAERLVVLITHRSELLARIPATLRLTVAGGKVQ